MNKSNFYNGIHGVLKAGILLDLTEDDIKEIYKCKKDPIYFIKNYYHIVSQEKGDMLLDLYDYQEDAINDLYKNHRLILNWARQSSKTTTMAAFTLHYIIFNKNKNAFFLANKFETSKEILDRVKYAYIRLPSFLQIGVREFNKSSLIFGNDSKIYASTTSPDSIRGKSASIIYVDEMSFCNGWSEFWSGISPTIAANKNAFVCLSSTPSGFNHFYKFVVNARNKTNGFSLSEIKWFNVPGRDDKWADQALKDLDGDEDEFAREYELQFLGASGCLISSKKLKSMPHSIPIKKMYDNRFNIYELPNKDHQYYNISDYGEGLNQDYSTIQVFKKELETFVQVAAYRDNQLKPREFAKIKLLIAEYYNDAVVIGESNIGKESLRELFDELEYENVFFDMDDKDKIGLRTTKKTKKLGCSYLKKHIENNKFEIVDFDTINELSTFVSKKNSYEADVGCTDDLIIPLVMFAHLINNLTFTEWYVDDYDMRSADIKVEKEDILPFFLHDGEDYYDCDGYEDVI